MRTRLAFRLLLLRSAQLLMLGVASARADDACQFAGRFASVEGEVAVQRQGSVAMAAARLGSPLCEGDTVEVGEHSRAAIQLANNMVLRLGQRSTVRLIDIAANPEEQSWLDLVQGVAQSFSRKPQRLRIDARHLMALIKGTEFVAEADPDGSRITVLEGAVQVSNSGQGGILVESGQAAFVADGAPPTRAAPANPRDSAQWSLFYPPVQAAFGEWLPEAATTAAQSLRQAALLADRGEPGRALTALDQVPPEARRGRYALLRTALLLNVGQAEAADAEIGRALRGGSDPGLAYALRSVAALARNRPAQALQDAVQATRLSGAAAASIALSYALQADFQIEPARDALLKATQDHPGNALAWARLGELHLMLGERKEALAAANQAAALAPDLARAQTVRGFCALADFRAGEAALAFSRAVRLASADPMAHLGLGLAKIASGQLAAGREDIEAAVSLDANNALLRAYLGKAYFEERRYPLDTEQYAIAQALDPRDPTAYLYSGILKQSANRPIEALRDLERSSELNDNRAVYRSRLLLDKDQAARTTSHARALNDLGFAELGIVESARSLATDPASAGAHRYLSDTYRNTGGSEIARVSELLQAQLLQDININPIQPSVAEAGLNIAASGGPATPGYNEFTPLFQRDMAQLNLAGFGGTQGTLGGEGVLTGVYGPLSLSGGAYSFDTQGWRPNNGLRRNIYNAFAQAAITDELNVQAEYRRNEAVGGDRAFNFDPEDYSPNKSSHVDQDTARFGLRYSPAPHSQLLFSYIHNNLKAQESDFGLYELRPYSYQTDSEQTGDQFEGQYIYQRERFNLVAGAAYNSTDSRKQASSPVLPSQTKIEHPRGYVYANLNWPSQAIWTLGLSYDNYRASSIVPVAGASLEKSSLSPKLGLQWQLTDKLWFRAAAFQGLKPPLVNNRTLEPTQVSGFNQFFDDFNATFFRSYGVGLNWRPIREVALGSTATWRSRNSPIGSDYRREEARENRQNLYLYWTPTGQIAVKIEFAHDGFRTNPGEDLDIPQRLDTYSVPLAVSYFHETGLFAGLAGTYVDQSIRRSAAASLTQGDSRFFLADTVVGYRFPKRLGILSIGVKNIFDRNFRYQDDSFREATPMTTSPYVPCRTFMAQLALSF
jgi:tetratricopeptide (TPR) repeat protein